MSGLHVSARAAILLLLSLLVQAFATAVSVGAAVVLTHFSGPAPALLLWAVAMPLFIARCLYEASLRMDRCLLTAAPHRD